MIRLTASLSALLLLTSLSVAGPAQDYADNCQDCHGVGRLGGDGIEPIGEQAPVDDRAAVGKVAENVAHPSSATICLSR